MNLAAILALLQQAQQAIVDLQNTQTGFTQADIDAAVLAAVAPLNDQVAALNAQVMAFPEQQTKAVLDAVAAAKAAFIDILKAIDEKDDKLIADAIDSLA